MFRLSDESKAKVKGTVKILSRINEQRENREEVQEVESVLNVSEDDGIFGKAFKIRARFK